MSNKRSERPIKEKAHYEDQWVFWLDDACYRVSRGARYLDFPSFVSLPVWRDQILPKIKRMEKYHKVVIRGVIDGVTESVDVMVARFPWVFDIMDSFIHDQSSLIHAVRGVLLGYDADKINSFIETIDSIEKSNSTNKRKVEVYQSASCFTCANLPPLKPCKALTGPTMQYTGSCSLRKPDPLGEYSNGTYTPLWIDFEARNAWEDGGRDIQDCPAYVAWDKEANKANEIVKE